MSGHCKIHALDFGYTCSACEQAWNYTGRTHLLDAFNAGVRGQHYSNQQPEYLAAWNDGQQYAKDGNKRDINSNQAKQATIQAATPQKKNPFGSKRDKKRYSKKQTQGDTMAGKKKATTTAPEETMSFDQMLGEATVASSAPKKGDKPVIKLNKDMSKKFEDFLRYKKEYKAAEGNMRAAEGPLLELCIERQDTDGLKDDFHGSYTVITDDGKTSATFITQDKFGPSQETEDQATLKLLLGDKYATEVVKTSTVILRPEVFADEDLKKELVAKMGADFSKFFMTTHKYSMKEGFAERIYRIANGMTNLIKLRMLCGKAKPYIK